MTITLKEFASAAASALNSTTIIPMMDTDFVQTVDLPEFVVSCTFSPSRLDCARWKSIARGDFGSMPRRDDSVITDSMGRRAFRYAGYFAELSARGAVIGKCC